MTTTISNEAITTTPAHKVSPMHALTDRLQSNAIAQARQKVAISQRGAELETLLDVPAFLDAFVHALARGIAEVLAENDKFVQAVYTYDPSINPDSESGDDLPVSATVHLLVRVSKPSAALEAFIASLDTALTAKLRELSSSQFAPRTSMLDVHLITEEDVQLGRGYAALLSSLFAPPIQVWQRNA